MTIANFAAVPQWLIVVIVGAVLSSVLGVSLKALWDWYTNKDQRAANKRAAEKAKRDATVRTASTKLLVEVRKRFTESNASVFSRAEMVAFLPELSDREIFQEVMDFSKAVPSERPGDFWEFRRPGNGPSLERYKR